MGCRQAVSYTHLDVYKRQEYPCYLPIADTSLLTSEGKITFTAKATFGDAVLPIDNMTVYFDAVSYTHLDVYKRQDRL